MHKKTRPKTSENHVPMNDCFFLSYPFDNTADWPSRPKRALPWQSSCFLKSNRSKTPTARRHSTKYCPCPWLRSSRFFVLLLDKSAYLQKSRCLRSVRKRSLFGYCELISKTAIKAAAAPTSDDIPPLNFKATAKSMQIPAAVAKNP